MAEENKNAAPTEEYNDDGTKNPEYVPPKKEGEGADAGTENKGADDKDKKVDEGGDKKDEEVFDDTIDPNKPPEIPIRKNVLQHIIARKDNKIKKLESKLKEGDEGYVAPTADTDEEDEETPLTDDAKGAISKEVNKAIAPLLGKMASEADEKELQDLIVSDPEAKKYVNHIKAYMGHEAYKGVSPVVIYHHLAWTAAQALGAKRKAAADLEAKQNKGGGRAIVDTGTAGDLPSADDIANMSDAEFAKMEEDALQGKFLKK